MRKTIVVVEMCRRYSLQVAGRAERVMMSLCVTFGREEFDVILDGVVVCGREEYEAVCVPKAVP
jgi:hypothetical protein